LSSQQLAEKMVSWIRKRVHAAGCEGVVLGLSGGLDSAVLAALCHRAFPRNMLAVIMPCGSLQEDKDHAQLVASAFSLPTREVVLDGVLENLAQSLPALPVDPSKYRQARGNLKVRLRMVVLYYIANQLNYLVVGSSNRSEYMVGYFTKYGDGGADILPLANLVKRQVRELAVHLGIPRVIIDKPPSAGLWEGQTDEGELGFGYDELDHYLLTGEAPEKLKNRIESMIASSAHKRSLPPIARF